MAADQPRDRSERFGPTDYDDVHMDLGGGAAGPLGFGWSRLPEAGRRSSVERVLFRFHRALPEMVWDAAVLEGSPFTFPEVQTLLDGVTVGGHRLSDQSQVLRLADANRLLRTEVKSEGFALDKTHSDDLHAAVATGEALEAGCFRGEGGENLRRIHAAGLDEIARISDPFHQGLAYFAFGALQQFYFDGNKRTARLMMNGHLMSHAYEAVSIPAARKQEYNEVMVDFYVGHDATDLLDLLASCQIGS